MGGSSKGSKGREGKGSDPYYKVKQIFPLPNGGTLIGSEVEWIEGEFHVHTRTAKRDWAQGVQMLFMYGASSSALEAAKPKIAEFIQERGTTRFGQPLRAYVEWDSPVWEPSLWQKAQARQHKINNRIAQKGKGKGDDSSMDRSLEEKGGKGKSVDGKGKSNVPFTPKVGTATTLMPERPAASCAAGAGAAMAPMYVVPPAPLQGSPSAGASETECTAAAGPLCYNDDSMSEAEKEAESAAASAAGEPLDEVTERYIEQKSPLLDRTPEEVSRWASALGHFHSFNKVESEPSDANGAPDTQGGTSTNECHEYGHPHPCPSGVHAGEESSVSALRKLEAGQAEAASGMVIGAHLARGAQSEQDMLDARRSLDAARASQANDGADDAIEAPADEIDSDDALDCVATYGYICNADDVQAIETHGYRYAPGIDPEVFFRQRERAFCNSNNPAYATLCRTVNAAKAKAKLNPKHHTCPLYQGPQQKRGRSNTSRCVTSNQSQGTGRTKSQGSDGKRQGSSTSSIIEKLSNCIKHTKLEWLQIAMREAMDLVRSEQIEDAQDKLDRIATQSLPHGAQGVCKEVRNDLCAIQINKISKHAKVLLVRTCLQQVQ